MRLCEVEDRFVSDLTTVLRNLIGRGDSKKSPQSLSYPALSNILKNMGYGSIDFDQFAKVYDLNPQLQPLIANYDEQGIQLGTKVKPAGAEKAPMDVPTGPSVDQMASSGAKAHLNKMS